MRRFAQLYTELDSTTKTNRKLAVLSAYFKEVEPADAAWAVYFLIGRKLKRLLNVRQLKEWGAGAAGLPEWLFEESRHATGDMAEAIALLLPDAAGGEARPLRWWVNERLLAIRAMVDDAKRKATVVRSWAELTAPERLMYNKLITGEFRVGVSQGLVQRALADAYSQPVDVVAHRLMGNWEPTADFQAFLQTGVASADGEDAAGAVRPYPFCLAHPLEQAPETLGQASDYLAEWKWDGLRAQLLRRADGCTVWSRGEEIISERFPEVTAAGQALPVGTVLDGEVLIWRDGKVQPFASLQKRIGRKTVSAKLLEDTPAVFLAYDILEYDKTDVRDKPQGERRQLLADLLAGTEEGGLLLSPVVEAETWEQLAAMRAAARERNVEGLMLKRKDAPYRVGRERGVWWKWKVDPHAVDAVMVYAQLGHGRRASLYSDYTFALWKAGELVPFCKAYSGLTDKELYQVDRWVREHTTEKFGPVRSVTPELVFEVGFEAIQRSTRHKSGVAVRFPRVLRWRTDKQPGEADDIERLFAMLPPESPTPADKPPKAVVKKISKKKQARPPAEDDAPSLFGPDT